MVRRLRLYAVAAVVLGGLAAGSYAIAGGFGGPLKPPKKVGETKEFRAYLTGYQETPSVSTTGYGDFRATLVEDQKLHYVFRYAALEGGASLFAHVHFGQHSVAGGVSFFLCGGSTKPTPCPNVEGTVEGDVTPADIVGPTGQGIEPGSFGEILRAMRAGTAYANLHTTRWPGGEIRGQVATVDKQSQTLTPGQEPHKLFGNVSKAKGGFTADVRKSDNKGTEMRWRLAWEGLTSRATAAHLHLGARGVTGSVFVFLCGTAKKPCINKRGGVAKLSQAQAQALEAGNIYVNVHTKRNPTGEIRAQLRKARLTLRAQG